jgi:outer membrane protein assembly factor BamB
MIYDPLTVSCLDVSTGKLLWRKEDFEGELPKFYTASSPIIVDGLCITQVTGINAYDLNSGKEKWKWTGDDASYGSPVLINLQGVKAIITPTQKTLTVLRVSDGEQLWQMPYNQGRQNAATPIVSGQTFYIAGPGRGMTASSFINTSDGFDTEELWQNPENSVQYNSPILSKTFIYGVSQGNELFSINAETGKTAWTLPVGPAPDPNREQGRRPQGQGTDRVRGGNTEQGPGGGQARRPDREGGGRGPGGGGSQPGFGSIVGTDSVLIALTPSSELIVFQPDEKKINELARYKVSDSPTYAFPVIEGNRIFIKDYNSVRLYSID